MPSHLQEFAEHLIASRGPASPGMVMVQFQNLGNTVPGDSSDARLAFVTDELNKCESLELDTDKGTYGVKAPPAA